MMGLLHKPLVGGVFGHGRYALASVSTVTRGLHSTRYMVVDPRHGTVLSVAEEKPEALAGARRVIEATAVLENVEEGPAPFQFSLWPANDEGAPQPPESAPRAIPRRRRAVYERCAGKCFYCTADLQLDAEWHVEHQLPRALGGTDDLVNLVAACAPCNLRKSDRTALEFLAA